MKTIAIIGGGITGLTAAFSLKQQGFRVCLFEEKNRTGGVIRSMREEGFLVESGPHSLMEKGPEIGQLLEDLGITEERIYSDPLARRRYVVRDGALVPLPSSPKDLASTRLLSARGKCRALLEPLVPRRTDDGEEETLAHFVERRLGGEVLDYAVNPFVGGIFAGDPGRLSVQHAFPVLDAMEREHGSLLMGAMKSRKKRTPGQTRPRLFSFREGLSTLTNSLTRALGEDILLKSRVEHFSRNGGWKIHWRSAGEEFCQTFDGVLIAAPAHRVPALGVIDDAQALLQPLKELPYSPVSLLTLGYRREDVSHPLDGFGALVPEKEKLPFLGIGFSSSVFPNRAPQGHVALSVYIGGARQPRQAFLPWHAQVERVLPGLQKLLGTTENPVFVRHRFLPKAIPQYNLGHGEYLNILAGFERNHPNLFFAGNYRCGISIGECIQAGIKAAARVQAES